MVKACGFRGKTLGKGQVAALVAAGATVTAGAATLCKANSLVDRGLTHLPVIARDVFYEHLAETMPGTEGLQFAETRSFIQHTIKDAQASLYESATIERVTIPAAQPAQTVVAYLYRQKQPSARWALLAHGYQGDHYDMDGIANAYVQAGFNVLSCDLRGHGESDGAYVGLGALEASDLSKWVGYLIARFGEDCAVVLHGQSLGAVACLIAAGQGLPSQVRAVVSDTAYTNALSIIRHAAFRAKLPGDVLAAAMRAVMLVRAHVDLRRADALAAVRSSAVPTLFLHGGNDALVPSPMAVELYTTSICEQRDLRVISGAGHLEGFAKDPDTYCGTVRAFLHQVGADAEW